MNLNKLNTLRNTEVMPLLFLGHGSPMNAIEDNVFVQGFRNIEKEIPKPNAILCVSAHWETRGTFVTAMEQPKTIHDFVGFPRELYEVLYSAPGNPELADVAKKIVQSVTIGLDYNWGLDHGAWSVIKHLYPQADIPVIELSLNYLQTPKDHFKIATELAPLREKGVLILGSGNIVHNLGLIAWNKLNKTEFAYDWSEEANIKIKKYILENNFNSLIEFKKQGKEFDLAIPTPEHFLPLLYILALKNKNEDLKFFNDKVIGGSLSMTSIKIG